MLYSQVKTKFICVCANSCVYLWVVLATIDYLNANATLNIPGSATINSCHVGILSTWKYQCNNSYDIKFTKSRGRLRTWCHSLIQNLPNYKYVSRNVMCANKHRSSQCTSCVRNWYFLISKSNSVCSMNSKIVLATAPDYI